MKGRPSPNTIARLSVAYIVAIASEMLHRTPLDFLDVLITLTIATAILEPGRRPLASAAPRGISRSVISRTLNVPLETVRRRVRVLIDTGIVEECVGGLIVPESSPMGMLANNSELLALNARLVRQLYRSLKAQGVRLD